VTRPRLATLVAVAIGIGVLDAVVFVVFEAVIDDGSDEVWNTLAHTDDTRWLVVPLAIVLSICFSFIVRLVGQSRFTEPKTDLLAEGIPSEPATVGSIAVIFLIGATSLIAGASLGPEASLVALSFAIGSWLAGHSHAGDDTKALVLASVGALLVAFVGSIVPVVIPLLLLRQQKMWTTRRAVLAVVAGITAYITLFVIQLGSTDGYGTIPASTDFGVHDFLTALGVGVLAVFVAHAFKRLVQLFLVVTKHIDAVLPWTLTAALFGAGLGLAYLAGGQTTEFSGQAGTKMLLQTATTYSAIALGGIALAKLVATAWSLTSGYRGGVVFPSIFMAVATGLFVSRVAGSLGGPGVVVGVVAGILTALTGAAFAIVLLASLLPVKLIGVAAMGAVGAVVCDRTLTRVMKRPASPHM
jgi:H+/Cl- antiporter ClcA